MKDDIKVFTIGHSTHSREEFLEIIKFFNIEILIDVRSYPGSRYMPHFNKEKMREWLFFNKIKYVHMPQLGGRRRKMPEIENSLIEGWEHIAFRNYAAYTLTEQFEKGLDELIAIAKKHRACIMCAEIVPWKCHRMLISNCLYFKKVKIFHIMAKDKFLKHEINKYGAKAEIKDGKIIYPAKMSDKE